MLASARGQSGEAFDRKGWIFEFKYDGYRLFAEKSARRRAAAVAQRSVVDGRSFRTSQTRWHVAVRATADRWRTRRQRRHRAAEFFGAAGARGIVGSFADRRRGRHQPATLYAFDLIEATALRPARTRTRRAQKAARERTAEGRAGALLQHIDEQGRAAFAAAQRLGIEGIVGKRAASQYQSGRSADWIKVRTRRTGDFVVVGWTAARSNRKRHRVA